MKYAFMTFSCPEATWEQVLTMASEYGYAAVEPRLDSDHKHGVELSANDATRKQLQRQAAEAGIQIACLALSCAYADPATRDQNVQDTHDRIDLAADMGVHRLRVFGGKIPEGISREQATKDMAAALSSLADHAAQQNVVVCMETHDDWCNPNDVATLMKTVDHPNIAVNWDIMHPVTRGGATMDEAYDILQPWIRYVHIHDGRYDDQGTLHFCNIGDGDVDHAQALVRLHEEGYDGYLSGEWMEWEPASVHLPREREAMRRLEAAL